MKGGAAIRTPLRDALAKRKTPAFAGVFGIADAKLDLSA
jgi:hypothetical protein